jgi:hypothetical protein
MAWGLPRSACTVWNGVNGAARRSPCRPVGIGRAILPVGAARAVGVVDAVLGVWAAVPSIGVCYAVRVIGIPVDVASKIPCPVIQPWAVGAVPVGVCEWSRQLRRSRRKEGIDGSCPCTGWAWAGPIAKKVTTAAASALRIEASRNVFRVECGRAFNGTVDSLLCLIRENRRA